MYTWTFATSTLEKGPVCVKVKAKDKQTAVRKGIAKVEAMNCTVGLRWECRLVLT